MESCNLREFVFSVNRSRQQVTYDVCSSKNVHACFTLKFCIKSFLMKMVYCLKHKQFCPKEKLWYGILTRMVNFCIGGLHVNSNSSAHAMVERGAVLVCILHIPGSDFFCRLVIIRSLIFVSAYICWYSS